MAGSGLHKRHSKSLGYPIYRWLCTTSILVLWLYQDSQSVNFSTADDEYFDEDMDEERPGSFDEACEPNAGPPDGDDGDGCPICGYWCVEPECLTEE
jgi:hypothetical protein